MHRCTLAMVLIVAAAWADDPATAAPAGPSATAAVASTVELPPLATGEILRLTARAKPDATYGYKLYLPAAHAVADGPLLPMLINHNPSGKTNLKPYVGWAEAQGVVLLGIDGISNGKEQGLKNRIADAVLADLGQRGVRVHPVLRFTVGMSGGSADGMRLVRRAPGRYAGLLLMGAGGVLDRADAKHLAYAILGGAKDEWMPGDACHTQAEKARAWGGAVRLEVDVDRTHQEAPIERQLAALTWLLTLQRLTLPALPANERAANVAAAQARLAAVGSIADPAARRIETELLLSLPPLRNHAETTASAVAAWASAMRALAGRIAEPAVRHAFLRTDILASPLAEDLVAETRAAILAEADGLLADPVVAVDWPLRSGFAEIEDAEIRAGIDPARLTLVLPRWQALATQATGTAWQARIETRIAVVRRFIDKPSSIQNPTR